MINILSFLSVALLGVVIVLLIMIKSKLSNTDVSGLISKLDVFEKTIGRFESVLRDEIGRIREEMNKAARDQRVEQSEAFRTFGDSVIKQMIDIANMQKAQLDTFSAQLGAFAKASGERLDGVRLESSTGAKQLREEVV
ncbi:MAG: DNA recombination protein RmuC, partial [Candidatus Omnitrophota bacterium]